jgi:predicted HTH transcriptional regulator
MLSAVSRYSETPAEQIIELTEAGYVSHGSQGEAAATEAKTKILEFAPAEEYAVGEEELAKSTGIPPTTAQRAVRELVAGGLLGKTGKGKKGNPFRYFSLSKSFSPQLLTIDGENQIESVSEAYPE